MGAWWEGQGAMNDANCCTTAQGAAVSQPPRRRGAPARRGPRVAGGVVGTLVASRELNAEFAGPHSQESAAAPVRGRVASDVGTRDAGWLTMWTTFTVDMGGRRRWATLALSRYLFQITHEVPSRNRSLDNHETASPDVTRRECRLDGFVTVKKDLSLLDRRKRTLLRTRFLLVISFERSDDSEQK